jgi:hypothetical protein
MLSRISGNLHRWPEIELTYQLSYVRILRKHPDFSGKSKKGLKDIRASVPY